MLHGAKAAKDSELIQLKKHLVKNLLVKIFQYLKIKKNIIINGYKYIRFSSSLKFSKF